MTPGGPWRRGLFILLALVAAVVLISGVIYMLEMPSRAPPGVQPSPHAIDQAG